MQQPLHAANEIVENLAPVIELPNEMWHEILKHFDLEKRQKDMEKHQKNIEQREQIAAQQEKHLTLLHKKLIRISNKINFVADSVETLCDEISSEIKNLGDSINNKLVLMEPHICAPLQNLQQHTDKLKKLLDVWYL